MRIKTSELEGLPLNWAVASYCDKHVSLGDIIWGNYAPSTNWAQGGPIIQREKLTVMHDDDWKFDPTDPEDNGERWMANTNDAYYESTTYGPTPLIAAMRCYVAAKLGETVELPATLLSVSEQRALKFKLEK